MTFEEDTTTASSSALVQHDDATLATNSFCLTAGQRETIESIKDFIACPVDYDDPKTRIFALSGAAGTGKTTLIAVIRDTFNNAVIAAPTNKAVTVLRQKGFDRATTVDRVVNESVYAPIVRPPTEAEIAFYKEHDLPIPATVKEEAYEKINRNGSALPILLVDEASMINQATLDQIIEKFPKSIFVGDGFQLPPVEGKEWFQSYQHDVHLTEIVRTSALSEITLLAGMIRNRDARWRRHDWHNEVEIIKMSDALSNADLWRSADVTLAHRNMTCNQYNSFVRNAKGLPSGSDQTRPQAHDRLMAWEAVKKAGIIKSDILDVMSAGELRGGYVVNLRCPVTGDASLVNVNKALLQDQTSTIRVSGMHQFSFAHCITAHKSQGSEWDHVVVLECDKVKGHDDYWNWLYTACTRAQKRLSIIVR